MTIIEAYQKYKEAGFKTLPTKPDKSPDVKGTWKGGVDDPAAYNEAFGIGIICGSISGNLECLDFDNHFGDAKETLSAFLTGEVKEIYQRYSLPIESTTSGGFHLLYRCQTIAGNMKLAQRPKKEGDRWRPDTIIETRGEGGYFCADPTPGYKVIRNNIFSIPEITSDERSILLSVARSFNTWSEIRKNEFEEKARPGDLFNEMPESIDEMKSALIGAGWKEISQGVWQRPGKSKGISATLGKVASNVFYCFTSNGHPFNENSGYTPFQAIGLLKYNGDFGAFAKDLAERFQLHQSRKDRQDYTPSSPREEKKVTKDLDSILNKSYIDLDIPVSKPPIIMRIRDIEGMQLIEKRLFTLGNFSVLTGKSKAKKTFLTTFFLATAAANSEIQGKFIADLPESKRGVLLFDTEQSRYDAWLTSSRIPRILKYNPENFGAFELREYSPLERCEIIDYALSKLKDSIGFVVIDGIADLAKAINDEEEASRVVSKLMHWTKVYNCHISVVIHQNKQDNFATGHLGSSLIKKAETVISTQKDMVNPRLSLVKCELIRGTQDFNDFEFFIDDDGLPQIQTTDPVPTNNFYEIEKDAF